jgi:L-fuconolactonase
MIDAHIHLWRYAPATHGWIGPGMEALKRDFLHQDLDEQCDLLDIEGVVAVQAAQTLDENRFLLECAVRSKRILGVVGWVDLRAPELDVVLDACRAHPRFVGVRHIAQDEPDDGFLARPEFVRGVRRLAPRGLAYDLLVHSRQLPAAIALVDQCPEQQFVLDHLGKPRLAAGEFEPWAGRIAALARRPNVVAKLSGLATEDDHRDWSRERVARAIDHALECFGPGRLMLGSDWPVCLLAAGQGEILEHARSRFSGLSVDERTAIESGVARRAYRLAGG